MSNCRQLCTSCFGLLGLISAVYLCHCTDTYLRCIFTGQRVTLAKRVTLTLNTKISSVENPAAKGILESELRLHQCKSECGYQQHKEDTALSQSSQDVDMITFDLQQSHPTPKLATCVVFYKHKMCTYNLGVHDCSNKRGFMFMWPESVTSRGSHEVCSCVFKYLGVNSTGASHLIAYSDDCGG